MSNLNAQQFKINLGDRLNEDHDWAERLNANLKTEHGDRDLPRKGQAPGGYYSQPSSNMRQSALPGMEMSVPDHLSALGKATGSTALLDGDRNSHRIVLLEQDKWGSTIERSAMSYNSKRNKRRLPDAGGLPKEQYRPGEIRQINSEKPGDASAMLETADRLAAEHGLAYPKHSPNRTLAGVSWSQKQMRKRGEKVW